MKKVALVTVNFGDPKDTLELLETVKKIDFFGLEYRLVVVDKTPGSWIGDHLKNPPANLELLQAGVDKGFAGGYNLGMRYAAAWGADYIMIINNDTLVGDSGLVKKMVNVLEKEPSATVVSPKIYFAPGFEYHHDLYKPTEKGKIIWYAGGNFDWNNIRSIHRGIDELESGKTYSHVEETGFISGCCLMVKRDVLDQIGYFDEDLFAYFEDNDWQRRILLAGGKLFYCGTTHIYHKVSRTMGIGSPQTDYLLTRNRLYFTFRYAKLRTKFAVFREMIRQLLLGRTAQKQGIIDFLCRKTGPSPYLKSLPGNYTYPVRLSVIVSDYKTTQLTENLIKSVLDPASGFDRAKDELIILDNATDDGCEAMVARYPAVRFIQNKVNKGFVGGYNRLLEYSRGEMVLLLNSDIEVKKGSLSTLIKASQKFNHQYVLTGKLLFPDGGPQDSCFRLPTIAGVFKEYFLKRKGSYFMFRPQDNHPVRVEGAVMADFLIPRNVINSVGYLNRKLFMYFEDIDYCRRLKKAGIPIYYIPSAMFFHHHGATAKKIGKSAINKQMIESSKIYHGELKYLLIYIALWLGQKWGNITTPSSRWEKDVS
jgi:hypothetical protein